MPNCGDVWCAACLHTGDCAGAREPLIGCLMAEDATSPGVARYRALVALWDAARAQAQEAGGELTQEQEVAHAGEIDRVWTLLTEDERDEIERNPSPPPAAAETPRPPHPLVRLWASF